MQLSDLNSKPRDGKNLRDLINRKIGFRFYSPPGSEQYKLFRLDKLHGSTHINDNHKNNYEVKNASFV